MLCCRLCDPVAGALVEPTGAHAEYAAADHLLDEHRPELLAQRGDAFDAVTVGGPG